MYHVVAATTNPAKLTAISQGFSALFGGGSCHIETLSPQAVILALCPFHHALYNTQNNFAASQSVRA